MCTRAEAPRLPGRRSFSVGPPTHASGEKGTGLRWAMPDSTWMKASCLERSQPAAIRWLSSAGGRRGMQDAEHTDLSPCSLRATPPGPCARDSAPMPTASWRPGARLAVLDRPPPRTASGHTADATHNRSPRRRGASSARRGTSARRAGYAAASRKGALQTVARSGCGAGRRRTSIGSCPRGSPGNRPASPTRSADPVCHARTAT